MSIATDFTLMLLVEKKCGENAAPALMGGLRFLFSFFFVFCIFRATPGA